MNNSFDNNMLELVEVSEENLAKNVLNKLDKMKNKIFYFKINNKYRAWCKLEGTILKIIEIDDHQK